MQNAIYLVLGALVVLLLQLALGSGGGVVTAPAPEPPDDATARIATLEAELGRVRDEVAALRVAAGRRSAEAVPPAGGTPPADAAATGTPDIGLVEARRFLRLYVDSFARDPKGSEYFRLAVLAVAHLLVVEVADLLRDVRQPDELRRHLIEMLGGFRGDREAIGALVDAARVGPAVIAGLALQQLRGIGSGADVPAVEALFAGLDPANREAALGTIVALAGADANASLLRLLRATTDPATRATILGFLQNTDPAVTLEVLRDAFARDVPERLAAAERLAGLRGAAFSRLVGDQLGIEREPAVRAALERAKHAMETIPPHHPLQATGPPDAELQKDDQRSWATGSADGGIEWLEVGFDPPRRASAIRIHEGCAPGAVIEVRAVDDRGRAHVLWKGADPTRTPGVFGVPMQSTSFPVRRVRIVLDTRRVTGWNEIDAVQLSGPDGDAWAATADASSYYGAGRGQRMRRVR